MPAASSVRLIKTKIGFPHLPANVVVRERLFELLDSGLTRPLTLISAPAGFGKTTLTASWLATQRDGWRGAWLWLDKDDGDSARFIRYLVAAVQTVAPDVGRAALSSLGGANPPGARDLVMLLLCELADAKERMVLVLDEYDAVERPEIDSALTYLVEHIPEQLRLVLLSRKTPVLPLSAWRAAQRMSQISAEDLLFSLEETQCFLTRTMALNIDHESGRKLWARTEGWIAGLQMAALSWREELPSLGAEEVRARLAGFGADHRYVVDYLAGEVLRHQPEEVRAFLHQTAILDRLCAGLCDAVTGRTDSKAMIDRLEQGNVFLLRLDAQRCWYRYHQLFSNFLRNGLDASTEQQLHRRACTWLEAHGYGKQAFEHAIAGRDIPAAVRLFRSEVEEAQRRGEIRTLLAWLDSLPDTVVRENADLAAHKAWLLYLLGRTAEGQDYARCVDRSDNSAVPDAQQVVVRLFHTYLALNWGDPKKAVPLAKDALLKGCSPFFRVLTLSFLGQAQTLSGQYAAALGTLREAFELGQTLGVHSKRLDALAHLVWVMQAQGQLREALALCRNAIDEYVDSGGRPLPIAGMVHVALGSLYYESDDLVAARNCFTAGLSLCRQRGILYYVLIGQRGLAKVQHACGERAAAWQTLAIARDLAERSGSPRRRHLIAEATAELQLQEDNVLAAAHTLHDMLEKCPSAVGRDSPLYARLLLAQNQPALAAKILERLEQSARREGSSGRLIGIHILQALCEVASGRSSAGLKKLEIAVALGATGASRRPFIDQGDKLKTLLQRVHHVAPDFVESLHIGAPESGLALRLGSPLTEPLTHGELELVRLLPLGLRNQEIADQLAITVGTTKQYLNHIFRKLEVRNRTEAIARAHKLGILRINGPTNS